MKRLLLATMAAIGLTGSAYAIPVTGQISIGGYAQAVGSVGMGNATGIDFASGTLGSQSISGTSGSIYLFGSGTGSFSGLVCSGISGNCGTIGDIANFSNEAATISFLTLATGGPTVSFDLSSIVSISHASDSNGGSVTFTADGTVNVSGYDPTEGEFILTTQGNNIVSFSATILSSGKPVPEPASLATLGGAVVALGLTRRRKRG